MPLVIISSTNHFNEELQKAGDKLVVVDFYADWCGPCRNIAPAYEQLSNSNTDVVFMKVNVDDNGELAGKYGVSGIPHFVFLKSSTKVGEFSGANKDKLIEAINKYK